MNLKICKIDLENQMNTKTSLLDLYVYKCIFLLFSLNSWFIACGREEEFSKLSHEQLSQKRICSKHFLDSDFIINGVKRIGLKYNCIPQSSPNLIPNTEESLNKSFDNSSPGYSFPALNDSSDTLTATDTEENSTVKRKNIKTKRKFYAKENYSLQRKVCDLKSKIKILKQALSREKKTVKPLKKEDIIRGASKFLNSDVLQFLKMQLNHDKKPKWEEKEKQFALGLYYKSPSAYNFLRDYKNFSLPCVSLIQSWVNIINFKPGENVQLSNQLKLKLQSCTNFHKECV